MEYNFEHQTEIRVRYGETDQMGYCYYGNYAMYFEVGRVETLRKLGMSYKQLEESGIMLPVSHFEVNYKSPAKYDDLLTVVTNIHELRGPRLKFDYIIKNGNVLIATATTTLVFVGKSTMKPIQAPKEFVSLMEPYLIKEK